MYNELSMLVNFVEVGFWSPPFSAALLSWHQLKNISCFIINACPLRVNADLFFLCGCKKFHKLMANACMMYLPGMGS
jgi:hypothetical protein